MVRPNVPPTRRTYSLRTAAPAWVAVGLVVWWCVLDLWHAEQEVVVVSSRMPLTQVLASYELQNHDKDSTVINEPVKVAHAISLITCQRLDRVVGFLDALVILRHSIHQNSVHNGRGRYSYQMYAFIHPDGGCTEYVHLLRRLGYIPLVKPTPVNFTNSLPSESWYLQHVEAENCCGSKEFIKLYAYTLTDHPIVVHWDLDVLVLTPMDDLFDAMLFEADSPRGKAARQKLQIQRPQTKTLPEKIDAFFTRDITSARPWERVTAVQGGFVVARPSVEHFRMYQDFIRKGDYRPGRGPGSGWAGLGYGGFQGAMAYQGVLAYFYDQVYPGHSVELDVCYWNQVVADVIWRGPARRDEFYGKCRDYPPDGNFEDNTPEKGGCHDCRVVPVEQTRTAHYTACKKPWECRIPEPRNPRDKSQVERLQELTNITTCMLLFAEYFSYRKDIEEKIRPLAGHASVSFTGNFHSDAFLGYCEGPGRYSPIKLPDGFEMKAVYGF